MTSIINIITRMRPKLALLCALMLACCCLAAPAQAEYVTNDWTFRSEYAHSTGLAFKTRYQKPENATDFELSKNGDKAQGVYALVIAPIIKKKMHAKARYDMYQPSGDASKQKTFYEVGLDYEFCRNLKLSGEYAFVNDRSLTKHNYNMVDVELAFRF